MCPPCPCAVRVRTSILTLEHEEASLTSRLPLFARNTHALTLLAPPPPTPFSRRCFQVEMVMRSLGLYNAKDTIVGDNTVRGVSGGERRRVTLGKTRGLEEGEVEVKKATRDSPFTTKHAILRTYTRTWPPVVPFDRGFGSWEMEGDEHCVV